MYSLRIIVTYIWYVIIIGSIIMGVGSMVFMVPHFSAEPHMGDSLFNSSSAENICRGVSVREQDMGLGPLSSGKNIAYTNKLLVDYQSHLSHF